MNIRLCVYIYENESQTLYGHYSNVLWHICMIWNHSKYNFGPNKTDIRTYYLYEGNIPHTVCVRFYITYPIYIFMCVIFQNVFFLWLLSLFCYIKYVATYYLYKREQSIVMRNCHCCMFGVCFVCEIIILDSIYYYIYVFAVL